MAKSFGVQDLKAHTSETDCYLAVNGKVYDVTEFLDEHPGGYDIILNSTGKDATEDFEEIGHSNAAHEMLEKYHIGAFAGGEAATSSRAAPPARQHNPYATQQQQSSPLVTALKVIAPIFVIAFMAWLQIQFGPMKEGFHFKPLARHDEL